MIASSAASIAGVAPSAIRSARSSSSSTDPASAVNTIALIGMPSRAAVGETGKAYRTGKFAYARVASVTNGLKVLPFFGVYGLDHIGCPSPRRMPR